MTEFRPNEHTDQLAGWLAALLPAPVALSGVHFQVAPQLHEILIRAGWLEPSPEVLRAVSYDEPPAL